MPGVRRQLDGTEETARFGASLARLLEAGDVLVLTGELGSGKTTLVRAIASSIGVDPTLVSSPTFTVLHEYTPAAGPVIVHADAYRLAGEDEAELDLLGWDEAVSGGAIVLIEWGERIADLLDREYATVELRHAGERVRDAIVEAPGAWADRQAWAELAEDHVGSAPHEAGSPFASERDQYADLYRWFSGAYRVSRPIEQADLDAE